MMRLSLYRESGWRLRWPDIAVGGACQLARRGRRAVLATLLARGEVRCGGVVPLASETRTRDGEPAAASPGTRRAAGRRSLESSPWTSPGFSQDGSDLGGIARVGRVTSDL